MKGFITIVLCVFSTVGIWAQATLPTIMVRPGNQWCADNGFMRIEDVQGQQKKVYDRSSAMNDSKMLQSIATIEALLNDEGLETNNLQGQEEMLDELVGEEEFIDDEDGNMADISALEFRRERATADIILDVNYSIEKVGPKKQLSYTLVGKDFYTGRTICNVTGLGEPSMSASEATLLREAVVGKMPELKSRMEEYFARILENGRNIQIGIRVSTGSDIHLMSSVEGGNVGRIINKWILTNAYKHKARPSTGSSRRSANYNVNISLYDTDGLPIVARHFAEQLSDFLASEPYRIKTMVAEQGLGRALLYIQGKLED